MHAIESQMKTKCPKMSLKYMMKYGQINNQEDILTNDVVKNTEEKNL